MTEALESRVMLSGVTVITHGFEGDTSGWVTQMANAISAPAGQSINKSIYTVTVVDAGHQGNALTVFSGSRSGADPMTSANPEIVILLDWSDVAGYRDPGFFGNWSFLGYTRSTVDVAAAVAKKLIQPGFLAGFPGSLAQLPFHFIGHSRGGSLVAELARNFGKSGIGVDQVTTSDPHPLTANGDPQMFDSSPTIDAPAAMTDNVVFADSYRQDWHYPTGAAVSGATGLNLATRFRNDGLEDDGPFWSLLPIPEFYKTDGTNHAQVRDWYYGTIDTSYQPNDGNNMADRSAWYAAGDLGYGYSRIRGGVRPAEGLWTASNRTRVELVVTGADAWDNVIIADYTTTTTAMLGSRLAVTPAFGDGNGDAFITVGLDSDRNPFNGFTANRETKKSAAGVSFSVDTSGLNTGQTYYVYAKITNGVHTRYAYALGSITLTSTPVADAPHVDSVTPSTFAGKPLGQLRTITINGTGFTANSTLRFNDGIQNYYSASARLRFIDSTRIEYDISVGLEAANWTVQVLDSQNSNAVGFTVTSTAVSYTKNWVGGFSNNWNDADNWSPVGSPQSTDTVTISGAVVNTTGFAVASVTLSSGAVMNWTSGYIIGSTVLSLAPGTTLNITGGDRNWSGEVYNYGTVNVNGPFGLYAGYGGNNYGALTVNNLASGTFNFQGDGTLYSWGNPITFNNAGTLKKTGGTGTTSISGVAFTNTATIQTTSGTLYFSGGTFYDEGAFDVSSGAVIIVANGGTFNAATSTGSGSVYLYGTLNGAINGSNYVLQSFSGGSLTLAGTMNWPGGFITGGSTVLTLTPGSVLNITGANGDVRNWSGELYNYGTVNVSSTVGLYAGYNSSSYGPLTINNLAGGTFDVQTDSSLGASSAACTFNNAGTFRKSGGTGTTVITGVTLTNTGTIQGASGTLYFSGVTFYDEGAFDTSSGAVIHVASGGTFAGATSTGSGSVYLSGTLNGTLSGSNFVLQSFSGGSLTLAGTMSWPGGFITGGNTILTLTPGSVLNITGGERNWSGELYNYGTVNVSGSVWLIAGYNGNNYGALTVNNRAGGTFNFQGDGTLYSSGNPIIFSNAGTLKKSGGTGTSHVYGSSVTFTNTGTIQATSGTLYLAGMLTNTGVFQATSGRVSLATQDGSTSTDGQFSFANNGTVYLQGTLALAGTHVGSGNGSFEVPGTLRVLADATLNFGAGNAVSLSGGITVIGGLTNAGSFSFNNGTIAGSGSVTNSGTFNWSGGTFTLGSVTNSGTFNWSGGTFTLGTVTNSGTFNWSGGTFTLGTVTNSGAFNWSGGTLMGSLINTSPAFSVTGVSAKSISGGGVLTNTGTITNTSNVGIFGGPGTFFNLSGALYDIQDDGSLSLEVNNYGTIRKSGGGATSGIGSPLRNFGILESNSGILAVGGYTQYAGSTLLNGGNLSGTFNLQGGELRGTGSVSGTVINMAGVIRPGLPLGYIVINGNYTQQKAGRAEFEIGGTIQGFQYDRLEVFGTATLDGTMQAGFVNGFIPSAAAQFNTLFHNSRSGQFSTMSLATASNGKRLTPAYNATGITLKMTSAPPLLVASSQFLLSPQRLSIQFSDDVGASLVKSDLSIIDRTFGITVPLATMAMSYDSGSRTATFTFPGYSGGALLPGDYRATLPARSVQDPSGMELASDLVVDFSVILDTTPPTADILDVAPDPHNGPVNQILIVFNETISGLELADLSLARNDAPVALAGATLTSEDGIIWTLAGLASATASSGNYVLTLTAAGSGIIDSVGHPLAADAFDAFKVQTALFTGTSGNDTYYVKSNPGGPIQVYENNPNIAGPGDYLVSPAMLASLTFDTGAGTNTVTIAGSLPYAPWVFGTGNDTLNLGAGTTTFAADLALGGAGLTLNIGDGANVVFAASQHLAGLNIGAGGTVSFAPGGGNTLVANGLTIAADGKLDLGDDALIVRNGNLAQTTAWIASGLAGGAWNGTGICSSAAAGDPQRITGLGIMLNSDGSGNPIYSTFAGQDVGSADVLVKYTYRGDTNLDGRIDGADYFRIDRGFLTGGARYQDGNINYNANLDGDDYFLIDSAFLSQTSVLAAQTVSSATPTLPKMANGGSPAGVFSSVAAPIIDRTAGLGESEVIVVAAVPQAAFLTARGSRESTPWDEIRAADWLHELLA